MTSITVGAGDVVSQSPKPGVSQKEGSTVTVVLSSGKPDVTVPSLSGMTCAQAATALQSAHFQVRLRAAGPTATPCRRRCWCCGRSARRRTRRRRPTGPPSRSSPRWATRRRPVPSIPTSYTFAQAQAALQAVGLTATQNNESNATVPSGQVISTSPASGASAPYGSAVTVNVSTGPPTTTVPNVIGDTVSAGHHRAASRHGLSVSGVSGSPNNNVSRHPALGRLDGARPAHPSSSSPTSRRRGAPVRPPTATSARRRACRSGTTRTTCAGWPTARCAACRWWCGSTTVRRRPRATSSTWWPS